MPINAYAPFSFKYGAKGNNLTLVIVHRHAEIRITGTVCRSKVSMKKKCFFVPNRYTYLYQIHVFIEVTYMNKCIEDFCELHCSQFIDKKTFIDDQSAVDHKNLGHSVPF